jgi:hypothetical protein
MIVQLFRNLADYKWFIAIVLLFGLFLPFDISVLLTGSESSLILNEGLKTLLRTNNSTFSGLLAVAMIIIVAVIYHFTLIRHKLLTGRNFLGLLYSVIFIAAFRPLFPSFNDILSASFILLAVLPVFASEDSNQPLLRIFDTAFLISIACIFDLNMLHFVIIPFVALVLFRQISWKLWVSGLTGLLLPQVFILSGYYLFNVQENYTETFISFFNHYQLSLSAFTIFAIPFAVIAPFMVLALLRTINSLVEKKIVVRKKIVLLMWIFVISVLLLLTKNAPVPAFMFIILMNLGFFMASSLRFLYEKRLFVLLTDLAVPAVILLRWL